MFPDVVFVFVHFLHHFLLHLAHERLDALGKAAESALIKFDAFMEFSEYVLM